MTTKREWVLKAFKNEKVDKVPVGFWYHFTTDDERGDGLILRFSIKISQDIKNSFQTSIQILSR